MAVTGTTTASDGALHFDQLLDGGNDSYLANIPDNCFTDPIRVNVYKSTAVISNVVDNFASQIYSAASGGSATVSLGNNIQADISTSAGAYQIQTYFLSLKTSAQTVALIESNQEKMHSTMVDALT